IAPYERPVNMMFQSYALFPHLSLWDNIAFGLRRESRDKAAISARVEEMLKLTRLEKFARRKPHQISGGQRQRVALARSLAKAPKLLLLDEPLGALDAKLREATQFELMDIQEKTGTTFVIVTHDQEEAMTVASRVAVMDEGRVMQVATPSDIYEAPSSAYVADFIGDVTIIDGVARASSAKASSAPSDSAHQTRKPQPNELGEWLHDKILSPVLGEREKSPEPAVEAPDLAHDGIAIDWADGQRPLIVTDGNPTLDGLPVKLALRPEKLSISRDKPQAVNAFEGRVIDIAYLGNLSTYHVELAGGQMIKAQVANTRRIARRDITWDDTVWVSWAGTAGVVLTE
ncbi:MAG: TOBE domain-containing protein, partial [Pseudomonadota bacterium]